MFFICDLWWKLGFTCTAVFITEWVKLSSIKDTPHSGAESSASVCGASAACVFKVQWYKVCSYVICKGQNSFKNKEKSKYNLSHSATIFHTHWQFISRNVSVSRVLVTALLLYRISCNSWVYTFLWENWTWAQIMTNSFIPQAPKYTLDPFFTSNMSCELSDTSPVLLCQVTPEVSQKDRKEARPYSLLVNSFNYLTLQVNSTQTKEQKICLNLSWDLKQTY